MLRTTVHITQHLVASLAAATLMLAVGGSAGVAQGGGSHDAGVVVIEQHFDFGITFHRDIEPAGKLPVSRKYSWVSPWTNIGMREISATAPAPENKAASG